MQKMVNKKHCILVLVSFMTWIDNGFGELKLTEDKPYEVINFKIPRVIWNQALHPTPVLKSTATVVLPIHIQEDYDEDEQEDEIDEAVMDTPAVTPAADIQQVVQDPVPSNPAPVAADVPQSPTLQGGEIAPLDTEQDVPGQVYRFPCSCIEGQCGCCTGSILDRVRMKACGNITFVPEDFVFDVRMSINNNTVVRRRVSASDPPPICFNPRRAPFVQVCAEISNIRIRNRNAFACLDINADIGGFPVYSASFRCFGLGTSGVQTGLKPKPVSSGPKPVSLFGSGGNDDDADGGFLQNVFGDGGGLFGGQGGGLFGGGSNNEGPFDGIGDAIGDFLDGRNLN